MLDLVSGVRKFNEGTDKELKDLTQRIATLEAPSVGRDSPEAQSGGRYKKYPTHPEYGVCLDCRVSGYDAPLEEDIDNPGEFYCDRCWRAFDRRSEFEEAYSASSQPWCNGRDTEDSATITASSHSLYGEISFGCKPLTSLAVSGTNCKLPAPTTPTFSDLGGRGVGRRPS